MKKYLLLFAIALSSLGVFAEGDYEKGVELFKKRQYKDALAFFEETIISHPDWYPAVYYKARCNYHLGNYQKALADLNDALTLEVPAQNVPNIKYYVAKSYMAMKDYDKAIASFSDILPLAPKSRLYDLYLNRGQAETEQARKLESQSSSRAKDYFAKSVLSYDKALNSPTQKTEQKVQAAFRKAFAQFKVAQLENSVPGLEKTRAAANDVISLDNKFKEAYDLLISVDFRLIERAGSDRQKESRFREAIPNLDRYLARWPNDLDKVDKKGKALQGAKMYPQAVEVFQQLVAKKPRDGEAFFSLGSCQMAAKNYDAARKSLEKAISLGVTKNPAAYTFTAYSLTQQKSGCYDKDIPLYEKAVNMLEKGVGNLSGAAKAAVKKDLDQKRQNLTVLQTNLSTDNQNHLVAIENIENLKKAIDQNLNKLQRNREMHLQQPTQELQAAIDEGQKRVEQDRADLDKEFQTLSKYLQDARKCGGAGTFDHYTKMKTMLDRRG